MIGCMRTRVHKQPIIALDFESETVLQFYNLEASVFIYLFIYRSIHDVDRYVAQSSMEAF